LQPVAPVGSFDGMGIDPRLISTDTRFNGQIQLCIFSR
jgi:hypothetical protein